MELVNVDNIDELREVERTKIDEEINREPLDEDMAVEETETENNRRFFCNIPRRNTIWPIYKIYV